jgi:hypothetical protein
MRLGFSFLFLAMLSTTSTALADDPDGVPGISNTGAVFSGGTLAPVSVVEGRGWKVGEGTVLRPVVGIETGVVSNVFFEDTNESPTSAGMLRLIAQMGAGSLSPQRLQRVGEGDGLPEGQRNLGAMQYRADLRLSYDLFLSGNDFVQQQGGLGVNALLRGHVLPGRPLSFLYLDNFQRLVRPTNFESVDQVTRDINRLQLGLQYAPQGRSIHGLLRYENVIDYFEDDDQQFANRLQHSAGLTVNWRFRPMTVFFVDFTQGVYGGLGADSQKVDSYPLTATTGVQTLLTLRTSLVARTGYTRGFYAQGPDFSAAVAGVQLGYRYSPRGRVTLMYDYNHQDSINANFFRDHRIGVNIEQQMVPVVFHVRPELRFRQYRGVTAFIPGSADTRDDVILAAAIGGRYIFRDWFAAVVEYRFSSVQTDFEYMAEPGVLDNPTFVRHEVVAGVRAAL